MKYIVIVLCLMAILLAFVIVVRYLKSSVKNQCCGNCNSCSDNHKCTKSNEH